MTDRSSIKVFILQKALVWLPNRLNKKMLEKRQIFSLILSQSNQNDMQGVIKVSLNT